MSFCMRVKMKSKEYFVYIVECSDGTYYTGYTTNIKRRLNEHNYSFKRGAKYTRSRRPVCLVYQESFDTMSEAMRRENQIKRLSRKQKIELLNKPV